MADLRPGDEAQAADVLRRAAELRQPLARIAKQARFYGASYIVIGGLAVVFGLIGPDLPSLLVGAAGCAVGIMERRDAGRLLRGEPSAAKGLARAELLLLAVVAVYCAFNLLRPPAADGELEQALGGAMPGMDVSAMQASLNTAVYVSVLLITVLVQGLLALKYLRQRAAVERYADEVPQWARDTLESVAD